MDTVSHLILPLSGFIAVYEFNRVEYNPIIIWPVIQIAAG